MENKGVKCDVTECIYNENGHACEASVIEVTNKTSQPTASDIDPHFCKTYEHK